MAKQKGAKDNKQKSQKHWDAKLSHKIRHTIITIVLTLLIVGGGVYGYIFLMQDTQASIQVVNNGGGTTKTVQSVTPQNVRMDEAAFFFELPGDWKKTGEITTGPHHKFSYQATLKNASNRYLDIYMDSLPTTMAVNKAVAVRSEGDHLSHGVVSDNCTTFTSQTLSALAVPAKWDGVDFLCDMDVKTRNVIGTSSIGNVNKVELTNVGFTKHSFFFVYTDHNYNPEYSIFYDVLDSFTLK